MNVAPHRDVHIIQVWAKNFDMEFGALLAAAAGEAGGAIVALDMEFPGFLRQEPRSGARAVRYQVLRENVERLRPIQLGAAVASADGMLRGAWCFNLRFDVDVDLHTAESVAFLRAAGIDFPRHAKEGIEAATLGRRLAGSVLVGQHGRVPWWVTFSGNYDLGYLLKLLTSNRPLPRDFGTFDVALSTFCPRRHELRDELPYGSLDSLAQRHGVKRHGAAHTAGSDALLTLELFLRVSGKQAARASHLGSREAEDARWGTSWHLDGTNGGAINCWDPHQQWYSGDCWDTGSWEASKWDATCSEDIGVIAGPLRGTVSPAIAWDFAALSNGAGGGTHWLPAAPAAPAHSLLVGTNPHSSALWGAALVQTAAMRLGPPVAPVDAGFAMRKLGWWMPKVTEI